MGRGGAAPAAWRVRVWPRVLAVLAAALLGAATLAQPARPASTRPTPRAAALDSSTGPALMVRVSGDRLVNGAGEPVRLLGVDRSGAEYACVQGWGIFDGPSDATSVAAMASWRVDAVRLPLNEDCWLGINGVDPSYAGAAYRAAIEAYVALLHAHGMAAILDLHWNAPGNELATGQQDMADATHAPAFWASVATAFKADPGVVFDLYNEPHTISWTCWLHGCITGDGWRAAGMQTLVDAVRGTGATQPIMANGDDWGGTLAGWLAHEPVDPDHQLVAGAHIYNFSGCDTAGCWQSTIAPVAAQVPVVTGELGEDDCAASFVDAYMDWADAVGVSYLGWTWDSGGGWTCGGGPSLITGYTGAPTPFGAGLETHLASVAASTLTLTGGSSPPPFATFTRVDGPTADATAAAELEHQFPPGTGACPGSTGARPVVLATDRNYPDALASAYLARSLGTGTLLTGGTTLSGVTLSALAEEGITHVYVVGGPLAVSTGVVAELASTPAQSCGGRSVLAEDIEVTRVAGQTAYTTAAAIARAGAALGAVGRADVPGAYGGLDGSGIYNDTSGAASAGPSAAGPLPTAVLATGTGFQDAEAASTLSYADSLPILLTTPSALSPQAASALRALGVEQVVVMGGPLAVSDAVVASVEAFGISVLRVAGQDDTDTAVQLADFETSAAPTGLGWAGTGDLTVARGGFFTDGLAGAEVAADGPSCASPEPLLLTVDPSSPGVTLADFLRTAGSTGVGGSRVSRFTILGGPLAVTQGAIDAMGSDL